MQYAQLLAALDAEVLSLRQGGAVGSALRKFSSDHGIHAPELSGTELIDWMISTASLLGIKDGPPWRLKFATCFRVAYKRACDHHTAHRGPGLLALERVEKHFPGGVLKWLEHLERQVRRENSLHLICEWLLRDYGYSRQLQEDLRSALNLSGELLWKLHGQDARGGE